MKTTNQLFAELRSMLRRKDARIPFSAETYRKGAPVIAGGRFGYWVGWKPLNNGKPSPPMLVQFNGTESQWFYVKDCRLATFGDYLFNPNGIGKTDRTAFLLIFLGCLVGTVAGLVDGGWPAVLFPAVFAVFLLGTYLNYRGIFK